ncbi:hypothetical protein GY21_16225 [Cryobacterium roopkundense]|uniref:Lipoprotein n=1 Tax=Cryobacterium roopkundense TaxID=1001240 RepID=A0A099J4B5_9MICO|nr:hypothetical protein GY21_16225 [Cryobacterium roopkundense]
MAMRKSSRGLLVGSVVLIPFLMLGCASGSNPQWTGGPAPSAAAPVFASNQEALAAATKAYEDYLAMSDLIANEGGAEIGRIADLVSPHYVKDVQAVLADSQEAGEIGSGATHFDTVSLVRYYDDTQNKASVMAYVCVDVTDVRIFDSSGVLITPANRVNRVPVQAGFISSSVDPTHLLVDSEVPWSGQDFC